MDSVAAAFETYRREAEMIVAQVLTRDDFQLWPERVTKAAAARFRRGLRVLEAYLKRLILLMALALEPELKHVERPERRPRERKGPKRRSFHFPILQDERVGDLPEFSLSERSNGNPFDSSNGSSGPALVPARLLLVRLAHLQVLAENPLPRARRLAFHLARCRPGMIWPPNRGVGVPGRWGTEVSALYAAMGHGIMTESRLRPPPLPPPRVPRPIISLL